VLFLVGPCCQWTRRFIQLLLSPLSRLLFIYSLNLTKSNPGVDGSQASKFCVIVHNVFSIIMAVFPLTYENVYQFTCMKQKARDNWCSQVTVGAQYGMALASCHQFDVWNLDMTLLLLLFFSVGLIHGIAFVPSHSINKYYNLYRILLLICKHQHNLQASVSPPPGGWGVCENAHCCIL
jgi:hypothetical protein